MNVMQEIVLALDTAHQAWKTQGVQSRGLLSLLVEFDRDRQYLSATSRERIDSDLAHFTLVYLLSSPSLASINFYTGIATSHRASPTRARCSP